MSGYLIDGKVYPFVSNLTFGDAPLVKRVTGLDFEEWAERVDAMGEDHPDVLAFVGVVAVAVSRAEGWSDEKTSAFVKNIDFENFGVDVPEGDAGPPPVASSPISSGESITSAGDLPDGVPV